MTPRPTSILTDRDGVFMAQLGGGPAGYGYWPVGAVPGRVADAILALEDRRFWDHPGVDPVAVARAAVENLVSARRVSGASTIAMQVARMQHPEARTLAHKICEAAAAVLMTARYGRRAVLLQYLTLVPFGENTHGIEEASAWYFDRPAADLSWAQIALLAAVPQSPGRYDLGRPAGLAAAKTRAAVALGRLRTENVFDEPTYREALADLAGLAPRSYPARRRDAIQAILYIDAKETFAPPQEKIHATIDLALQSRVSVIAKARFASLQPFGAQQFAVIVADRRSMDVLALVGSDDYAPANEGKIDYAARWRSPGSTLKPFIFAQALDRGAITPASVLQDAPDSGTGVANADLRFLGPMLPEQALGNSRNVPAAVLVRRDGVAASQVFLSRLGLADGDVADRDYGVSLAVGAMPTRLDRLVAAYGALANDGIWQNLRWTAEETQTQRRMITVGTARSITLFLADPLARLPSFSRMGATEFPFPVAVKTGTSQGFRDAWAMEYTDRYVIGVWVGRPDGAPMDQLGGITSAALIGHDILMDLYHGETDGQNDTDFAAPPGSAPVDVCAATPAPAPAHCEARLALYLPAHEPSQPGAGDPGKLRITSPLNRENFILNPDAPAGLAVLTLHAQGGGGSVEWFVDGQPYQIANEADSVTWPVTPGRHVFLARDPRDGAWSNMVSVDVR